MDIKKLMQTLHPLERKVLPLLDRLNSVKEIEKNANLQEVEVMRALQWMQNKSIIKLNERLEEIASLDENGKEYLEKGLPEKKFLQTIKDKELSLEEIKNKAGLSKEELNVSLGILKSKNAILIKKDKELKIKITQQGKKFLDDGFLEENFLKKKFPLNLKDLKEEDKFSLNNLKRRKEIIKIDLIKEKIPELTDLGKQIIRQGIKDEDVLDKLTISVLKTGTWKNKNFRRYDVKINVPEIFGGKRHFVQQAINYIKSIWLDMGFKEMTGNLVQTSFWDLDALFVPQDHPARDMQDTFYIKNPKYGKLPKLFIKVKATHENGWTTGSKGWRYKWSEDIAKENLLRTHTTVLSAQTISKLKKENLPAKFFSVNRVYRNETLSWKSLFEFIQVEGIVVDPNANFKNLKGYLKEFFKKMGFSDVRIRPAHFPYTEPSAEVDVFHPLKKKWMELGGSGIFRPEVVKPLLGIECPVLAWGLGLERTIMEYYNITDIRDVYKNDLKHLREIKIWMK